MRRARRLCCAAAMAALLAAAAAAAAGGPSVGDLPDRERAARQSLDWAAAATYRSGLARVLAFARSRPELFPPAKAQTEEPRLLGPAERDAVRSAWKSVVDYTLALESLEDYHDGFALLADAAARARSFHVANAAFRAAYRFGLEFIGLVENDPKLGVILNDAAPDLGLPAGSYDRYKTRYLNVAAATRFAAYAAAGALLAPPGSPEQARAAQEDGAFILAQGRGRGEALTAANGLNLLRRAGSDAVFPVQAGVSEWMGDTKVRRQGHALIAPAQIAALRGRMQPGDVMLQRREWYVSNVGLPGFWSHAALYVGTAEERQAFFATEEVRRWVASRGEASGELERLLASASPAAAAASRAPGEGGHVPRVLEAVSEGVIFTTLEHSAAADSVVVLRPRLPRAAVAAALLRAWSYFGRPYDYEFDFQTDSALVCTELIVKSYQPEAGIPGLRLQLEEILGRTTLPANGVARQFDEEGAGPGAQLAFIAFLDGRERAGVAVEAGVDEFRASWRRPKWHVLVQDRDAVPGAPP